MNVGHLTVLNEKCIHLCLPSFISQSPRFLISSTPSKLFHDLLGSIDDFDGQNGRSFQNYDLKNIFFLETSFPFSLKSYLVNSAHATILSTDLNKDTAFNQLPLQNDPRLAALTKPSVLDTWAQVEGQLGTYVHLTDNIYPYIQP